MKMEIEEKLANAILQYLQNKPYIEVHVLINELLKLQPIKDKEVVENKEVIIEDVKNKK